ncbi:ABC transporter ATP-binding protein [Gemmatimonas sp.]|jgi:subfamily B ATP-binding cassette protein MsbA|uniref:ABC transporter ATP-binding protein n=1 Tax=Gemmatimonas sp. TaxID=1962908 RepID=UPI0037C032D4
MSPRPLARLAPLVRPYTSRLVVAFLFLVVAAAAGLVFPAVLRYLLDAAFELKDRGALDRIALGLLGVFAVQGVANFVQVFLLSSSTERIVATLREQTFAHLIRLSPAFFTERRTGELTSRLSSDLALLQSLLSTWISELSRQTLFLIGGIAMMFVTNPRLTLTTLAVVPVVVVAAFTFGRALRKASTSVQDRIGEAMGMADESFGSIRTVQSFTREGIETERFSALLHDLVGVAVSRARIRALFFGVVGFVAFGSVAAVLWQGGAQVVEGKLTAGTLVAFLFYALFVAAAVGTLATLFGNFQEAIGAASRVFDLLDAEPTVREPEHPRRFTETVRGAVTLEAVAFRYQPDLPDVVQDISLDIAPGEVVALVGRSGAGKTTIASLLPRFWDVTAGRITLDGIDIRELSLDTLRGAIGIVPQEPVLFSGSIRENIAYARPDASDADVLRAAQAAHAWEFIERLPEQWSTRVGERGVKLSGGQRQRIAIARVFLKDPAVVILDEATSSLDTESERYVEQALEQLLQGRTTLLIAHRLSTVRRADRVVVLDQGRIVETGSHDELLQRENGLFARLHQLS